MWENEPPASIKKTEVIEVTANPLNENVNLSSDVHGDRVTAWENTEPLVHRRKGRI